MIVSYNFAIVEELPFQISSLPSWPPDTKPFSFQSIVRILPELASRSNLNILPAGFRISHTRTQPSNEPLANIFGFSGDAERLVTKPSWPLRVVTVIDCARGSCKKILFVVVPNARSDTEDNDAIDSRGAEKGVEDMGCDEVFNRSCV